MSLFDGQFMIFLYFPLVADISKKNSITIYGGKMKIRAYFIQNFSDKKDLELKLNL